jgi:hypothetical protein
MQDSTFGWTGRRQLVTCCGRNYLVVPAPIAEKKQGLLSENFTFLKSQMAAKVVAYMSFSFIWLLSICAYGRIEKAGLRYTKGRPPRFAEGCRSLKKFGTLHLARQLIESPA